MMQALTCLPNTFFQKHDTFAPMSTSILSWKSGRFVKILHWWHVDIGMLADIAGSLGLYQFFTTLLLD